MVLSTQRTKISRPVWQGTNKTKNPLTGLECGVWEGGKEAARLGWGWEGLEGGRMQEWPGSEGSGQEEGYRSGCRVQVMGSSYLAQLPGDAHGSMSPTTPSHRPLLLLLFMITASQSGMGKASK